MRTKVLLALTTIAPALAARAFSQTLRQGVRKKASMGGIAAFRKHVDPAAVSIVKAGDFKAAGVYQ